MSRENKTCIRGSGDKVVQCIKGMDANGLYLYALMQHMPSDITTIRKAEKDFKVERQSLCTVHNRQWLSWVSHSKAIHLQRLRNAHVEEAA